MWDITEESSYKLYKSDICILKIFDKGEKSDIYVNYKGYNPVMVLGIWDFGDEINERNIDFEIKGENGSVFLFYYSVNKRDVRLFSDMIFFYLSEHNIDGALNEKFRITEW